MALILQLKKRKVVDVDMAALRRIVADVLTDNQPREQQVERIVGLLGNMPRAEVHDKFWLSTIVSWVNERTPFVDLAPWLRLAEKIGRINEAEECEFKLSKKQADLIFERLRDKNFTPLRGLSPALAEFVIGFCQAGHYTLSGKMDEFEEEEEED